MPKHKRIVALAIGVAHARPLQILSGAIHGARGFHEWASAVGYEAILLTDEKTPVTLRRLQNKFKAIFQSGTPPVHRLLLYFAGHGLIREAEEGLWLLSDWHQKQYAIAIEVLKRRLRRYDVKQIAIFADACRLLPSNMDAADLTPEGVLERGPSDPPTLPAVDKFIAAQDGRATYMIPAPNHADDRCLFSGVLLEGLWGTTRSVFSSLRPNVVTSQSLGRYLSTAVNERAQQYQRTLHPFVAPTFPEDDDVYFDGNRQKLTPPAIPKWPPADWVLAQSMLGGDPTIAASKATDEQRANTFEASMVQQSKPTHYETQAGFAVAGMPVVAFYTTHNIIVERDSDPTWWRLRDRNTFIVQTPTPVLFEFSDGRFAAVTALPHFVGSLLRDEQGVNALIYRRMHLEASVVASTEAALKTMEAGRLQANMAINYALNLRRNKHNDPMYGVISAYLYDAMDDRESICNMAYYYVQHEQPIPFDIAMLAQLRSEWRDGQLWAHVPAVATRRARTNNEQDTQWALEATPATTGCVGGWWPWLRQGWAFLEPPTANDSTLTLPGLDRIAKHLTGGRFTTLNNAGGIALARRLKLVRQLPT